MEHDAIAFNTGAAEANRDIAAGRLQLFSGAPSKTIWGLDLAKTLRDRFEVEVIFRGCLVTGESVSYEAGYNSAVEAHVDSIWGRGAFKNVHEEVQQRRKQLYDAWVATEGSVAPRDVRGNDSE